MDLSSIFTQGEEGIDIFGEGSLSKDIPQERVPLDISINQDMLANINYTNVGNQNKAFINVDPNKIFETGIKVMKENISEQDQFYLSINKNYVLSETTRQTKLGEDGTIEKFSFEGSNTNMECRDLVQGYPRQEFKDYYKKPNTAKENKLKNIAKDYKDKDFVFAANENSVFNLQIAYNGFLTNNGFVSQPDNPYFYYGHAKSINFNFQLFYTVIADPKTFNDSFEFIEYLDEFVFKRNKENILQSIHRFFRNNPNINIDELYSKISEEYPVLWNFAETSKNVYFFGYIIQDTPPLSISNYVYKAQDETIYVEKFIIVSQGEFMFQTTYPVAIQNESEDYVVVVIGNLSDEETIKNKLKNLFEDGKMNSWKDFQKNVPKEFEDYPLLFFNYDVYSSKNLEEYDTNFSSLDQINSKYFTSMKTFLANKVGIVTQDAIEKLQNYIENLIEIEYIKKQTPKNKKIEYYPNLTTGTKNKDPLNSLKVFEILKKNVAKDGISYVKTKSIYFKPAVIYSMARALVTRLFIKLTDPEKSLLAEKKKAYKEYLEDLRFLIETYLQVVEKHYDDMIEDETFKNKSNLKIDQSLLNSLFEQNIEKNFVEYTPQNRRIGTDKTYLQAKILLLIYKAENDDIITYEKTTIEPNKITDFIIKKIIRQSILNDATNIGTLYFESFNKFLKDQAQNKMKYDDNEKNNITFETLYDQRKQFLNKDKLTFDEQEINAMYLGFVPDPQISVSLGTNIFVGDKQTFQHDQLKRLVMWPERMIIDRIFVDTLSNSSLHRTFLKNVPFLQSFCENPLNDEDYESKLHLVRVSKMAKMILSNLQNTFNSHEELLPFLIYDNPNLNWEWLLAYTRQPNEAMLKDLPIKKQISMARRMKSTRCTSQAHYIHFINRVLRGWGEEKQFFKMKYDTDKSVEMMTGEYIRSENTSDSKSTEYVFFLLQDNKNTNFTFTESPQQVKFKFHTNNKDESFMVVRHHQHPALIKNLKNYSSWSLNLQIHRPHTYVSFRKESRYKSLSWWSTKGDFDLTNEINKKKFTEEYEITSGKKAVKVGQLLKKSTMVTREFYMENIIEIDAMLDGKADYLNDTSSTDIHKADWPVLLFKVIATFLYKQFHQKGQSTQPFLLIKTESLKRFGKIPENLMIFILRRYFHFAICVHAKTEAKYKSSLGQTPPFWKTVEPSLYKNLPKDTGYFYYDFVINKYDYIHHNIQDVNNKSNKMYFMDEDEIVLFRPLPTQEELWKMMLFFQNDLTNPPKYFPSRKNLMKFYKTPTIYFEKNGTYKITDKRLTPVYNLFDKTNKGQMILNNVHSEPLKMDKNLKNNKQIFEIIIKDGTTIISPFALYTHPIYQKPLELSDLEYKYLIGWYGNTIPFHSISENFQNLLEPAVPYLLQLIQFQNYLALIPYKNRNDKIASLLIPPSNAPGSISANKQQFIFPVRNKKLKGFDKNNIYSVFWDESKYQQLPSNTQTFSRSDKTNLIRLMINDVTQFVDREETKIILEKYVRHHVVKSYISDTKLQKLYDIFKTGYKIPKTADYFKDVQDVNNQDNLPNSFSEAILQNYLLYFFYSAIEKYIVQDNFDIDSVIKYIKENHLTDNNELWFLNNNYKYKKLKERFESTKELFKTMYIYKMFHIESEDLCFRWFYLPWMYYSTNKLLFKNFTANDLDFIVSKNEYPEFQSEYYFRLFENGKFYFDKYSEPISTLNNNYQYPNIFKDDTDIQNIVFSEKVFNIECVYFASKMDMLEAYYINYYRHTLDFRKKPQETINFLDNIKKTKFIPYVNNIENLVKQGDAEFTPFQMQNYSNSSILWKPDTTEMFIDIGHLPRTKQSILPENLEGEPHLNNQTNQQPPKSDEQIFFEDILPYLGTPNKTYLQATQAFDSLLTSQNLIEKPEQWYQIWDMRHDPGLNIDSATNDKSYQQQLLTIQSSFSSDDSEYIWINTLLNLYYDGNTMIENMFY